MAEPITDEALQALIEAHDAIGPWQEPPWHYDPETFELYLNDGERKRVGEAWGNAMTVYNRRSGEFIAALSSAFPAIVARIKDLKDEVADYEQQCPSGGKHEPRSAYAGDHLCRKCGLRMSRGEVANG